LEKLSWMFIPDPDFFFRPESGSVKKRQIPDPDIQHWDEASQVFASLKKFSKTASRKAPKNAKACLLNLFRRKKRKRRNFRHGENNSFRLTFQKEPTSKRSWTPTGQIRSGREWYQWIGLTSLQIFYFFIFYIEFLKEVAGLWALTSKIYQITNGSASIHVPRTLIRV
jgi:hypothetical protein